MIPVNVPLLLYHLSLLATRSLDLQAAEFPHDASGPWVDDIEYSLYSLPTIQIVSEAKGQGFGIDNQYPFKSLRGGSSTNGGDRNQVLLLLTSSGKNLNEVISALSNISPTMPYR